MGATVLHFAQQIVSAGDCITCGVQICMPEGLKNQKLRDQTNFYCCNGHPQHYVGKTKEQELQEALDQEKKAHESDVQYQRTKREEAERRASAARGQVTRIKNRVGNGVCPCCNRTFQNLMKHMHTQHPDFKDGDL